MKFSLVKKIGETAAIVFKTDDKCWCPLLNRVMYASVK